MNRNIIPILLSIFFGLVFFSGCKTNEKNYAKAYEKAVAKNDRGVTDFNNTIYSRYRNQMRDVPVKAGDETFNTKMLRVKVTEEGGGIKEWLKKYSVVVAEFKQRFNANSLRQRFIDAGYPRTFLVENAEPYYYVVVASSNDIGEMADICDSLKTSAPLPLKQGFPYILQIP